MLLRFNADAVRRLLEQSHRSAERHPTFDQLFDQTLWRDDLSAERRHALTSETDLATPDDVDYRKVPVGLHLVGDRGVYICTNAVSVEGDREVVYAEECNPLTMTMDAWYDAKKASFGPDDGVDFLPAQVVETVLQDGFLHLDVSPEGISFLTVTRSPTLN